MPELWLRIPTCCQFWLKGGAPFERTTGGTACMELVVTHREGDGEESDRLPSLLLFSWVIIGTAGFLLGWVCSRAFTRIGTWWHRAAQPGRWETLVQKAIFFIGRRRRVSLAFGAYRNSSLRNTPAAKPNSSRRALRARATTPRPPVTVGSPQVLNEGPAIVRHHGPDRD